MDKYILLKERFSQNINNDKAAQMSAYMRDQFVYYGIPTPERKKLCKDIFKAERASKKIDWPFLDQCFADEHREFQYVVMDYLAAMQQYLVYDDIPHMKEYAQTKQWWDTIDGLDRIIGDIGLKDNRVDALMLEWSTDDDFWLRRIAIDHQLTRKDQTNAGLLEKILCNNFGSEEFFINKAIGWSLRDYSKTNPVWVQGFIQKHKHEMAALSVKEASKYI